MASEDGSLHNDDSMEDNSNVNTNGVTMKMIDFAHATFKGFRGDQVEHIGPDAGYIKGLDSLISILTRALESS